jgi:hypothetical protein
MKPKFLKPGLITNKPTPGGTDLYRMVVDKLVEEKVLGTLDNRVYFLRLPILGTDFVSTDQVPIGGMWTDEGSVYWKNVNGNVTALVND